MNQNNSFKRKPGRSLASVLFLGFAALSLVGCDSQDPRFQNFSEGVASTGAPLAPTTSGSNETVSNGALGQNQVGDFSVASASNPNLDPSGKNSKTNPPVLGFRPPSLPSLPKLPKIPKLPSIPKLPKFPKIPRLPPIRFPRFGGFRGPSCFVAGTKVWTPAGARSIETLVVGEPVLTRADVLVASVAPVAPMPQNGPLPENGIVRVTKNTSDHLRILVVSDANGKTQTIRTTDGHPFWVQGLAWIDAADLLPGLRISAAEGQFVTVRESRREEHVEGVAVYNLEVAFAHAYRIGVSGILVKSW